MASSMAMPLPDFYIYYANFGLLFCKLCSEPLLGRKVKNPLLSHLTPHEISEGDYQKACDLVLPTVQTLAQSHQLIQQQQPIQPFSELPNQEGYKCGYAGCRNLYLSLTYEQRELKGLAHIQPQPTPSVCEGPTNTLGL
jgi:hypothetical protein